MINKGDILFTCITNVAKNGNLYGVFVRLNDTVDRELGDYRWSFELVKHGDEFLIPLQGRMHKIVVIFEKTKFKHDKTNLINFAVKTVETVKSV